MIFILGLTLVSDRGVGLILVLYILISLGGIYLMAYYLSLGSIELQLNQMEIRITWIKRFLWSKEKDYSISLNEILHYSYQEVNNFEWYKLILTNRRQIVLNRFDFPFTNKNDDFEKFVQDLPEFLESRIESDQAPITEGPTIYDDRIFRWALYLMTGVTIYFVFDYLFNPDRVFMLPKLLFISFNILFYWLRFRRVKN